MEIYDSPIRKDIAIGFYGIAYTYAGQTTIAYRGTDQLALDTLMGYGTGSGTPDTPQAQMAFQF